MLSPEAYSLWKPYNAGCRVYIIYPHLMPGYIINNKEHQKMHAFISQTIKKELLCSSFSPTLWAASLHSTKSVGWSWKENRGTSPSFNFWNLCCDLCCHRSTVLQHPHSFIHGFVLHMHASVSTGKPEHLKSSTSFYSNLKNSHDNFVFIKQQIENLFWSKTLQ